jgi:hypothetical protein
LVGEPDSATTRWDRVTRTCLFLTEKKGGSFINYV